VVLFPKRFNLSGIKTMLLLTGEYEHSFDNKSRVLISNKLRSQIDVEEHGSNFYVVLGPTEYFVYTRKNTLSY